MDIISISDSSSACSSPDKNKVALPGSSVCVNNQEKPFSVSSESTLRCPVSAPGSKSKLKFVSINSPANKTPSVHHKVKTWFDKCPNMKDLVNGSSHVEKGSLEKVISPSQSLPPENNLEDNIPDNKGSILIRLTYNKNKSGEVSTPENSVKSKNNTVIVCGESSSKNSNSIIQKHVKSEPSSRKRKNSEHIPSFSVENRKKERSLPPSSSPNSKASSSVKINASPSVKDVEKQSVLAPLSPETRKKNEFCSYLQLMDSNTTFMYHNAKTNRRSTRDQHRCNYNEKVLSSASKNKLIKKPNVVLEKVANDKINNTTKHQVVHNGKPPENKEEACRKSFKELKIHLQKLPCLQKIDDDYEIVNYFYDHKHLHRKSNFEKAIMNFFVKEGINFEKNRQKISNSRRNTAKSIDSSDNTKSSCASSDKENQSAHDTVPKVTKVEKMEPVDLSTEKTAEEEVVENDSLGEEKKPKRHYRKRFANRSRLRKRLTRTLSLDVIRKNKIASELHKKLKQKKANNLRKKLESEKQKDGFEKEKDGFEKERYGFEKEKEGFEKQKDVFEKQRDGFEKQKDGFHQRKDASERHENDSKKLEANAKFNKKVKHVEIKILHSSFEEEKVKSIEDKTKLSPIIKCLRQNEQLKKLAPEHFKALVETKKFLNPKTDEFTSPQIVPTIVQKVQHKNLVVKVCPQVDRVLENVKVEKPIEQKASEIQTPELTAIETEDNDKEVSTNFKTCDKKVQIEDHDYICTTALAETDHCYHLPNGTVNSYETETINGKKPNQPSLQTVNTNEISPRNCTYIPVNTNMETKTLQRSLVQCKRKLANGLDSDEYSNQDWDSDSPSTQKNKGSSHRSSFSIQISEENGDILYVFYIDFNLVVAQEQMVSFWNQTALGNVLGSQDMWLPKGSIQRLILDSECSQKPSSEMMVSMDSCAAYIELWTKEHKSFNRERPVADVFAAVYYWRSIGIDKKVLQLENIKGFAEDVQYIVLRNSRSIIVSWNTLKDDDKTTIVQSYNLANDYQSIVNIKQLASVDHYVSSLHNIEDCDSIIMGSGDHRITLWNIEYGYIVSTIDLLETRPVPKTLWVKCDRGFLFTLQMFDDEVIRLIAINGISHKWKKLQLYKASERHTNLKGVCIENGILAAFYETGVCCWNVQHGECVVDEILPETVYVPSSKHVLLMADEEIHVHNALSYLLTLYDP